MLIISDLLAMNNEELYEVYLKALKDRNLRVINTVRSIISDRYSIKALRQSQLDNWKSNPDIARFFTVK